MEKKRTLENTNTKEEPIQKILKTEKLFTSLKEFKFDLDKSLKNYFEELFGEEYYKK
jgi:hypothetical protein